MSCFSIRDDDTCFFHLPEAGGKSFDLNVARQLLQKGHDVTAVTANLYGRAKNHFDDMIDWRPV